MNIDTYNKAIVYLEINLVQSTGLSICIPLTQIPEKYNSYTFVGRVHQLTLIVLITVLLNLSTFWFYCRQLHLDLVTNL